MATVFWKTGFSGGTADDVDGITGYTAGDWCFVTTVGSFLCYMCIDSSATVDEPWVIAPDDVGGGGERWHHQHGGYEQYMGFFRSNMEYSTSTNVLLRPGGYNLFERGWVYWDSTLTYSFISTPDGVWRYLYIDFSDISQSGVISNAELIDNATVPVWAGGKGGWYNGDDLCIGMVVGNGSDNITHFTQNGNLIIFHDYMNENTTTPGTSFTNYGLDYVPPICTRALLRTRLSHTITCYIWTKPYGSAATVGRQLNQVGVSGQVHGSVNAVDIGDDGGTPTVSLKSTVATTPGFQLDTHGFYLPYGM